MVFTVPIEQQPTNAAAKKTTNEIHKSVKKSTNTEDDYEDDEFEDDFEPYETSNEDENKTSNNKSNSSKLKRDDPNNTRQTRNRQDSPAQRDGPTGAVNIEV